MQPTLTDEQKKDVEERTAEFWKRHETNVAELQVNFASFPVYIPNAEGVCATAVQTQIVDAKYKSTPSPIIV